MKKIYFFTLNVLMVYLLFGFIPAISNAATDIPVPIIVNPLVGAIGVLPSTSLSWKLPTGQSLPSAGSFEGELYANIEENASTYFTTSRSTLSWKPPGNFPLAPGVEYNWKVRACKSAADCGTYVLGNFTVRSEQPPSETIPTPIIGVPRDGAIGVSPSISLSWTLPTGQSLPSGGSFEGKIYVNVIDGDQANFTTSRSTLSWKPSITLYSGVEYNWMVRACKSAADCGTYAFSSFTVGDSGGGGGGSEGTFQNPIKYGNFEDLVNAIIMFLITIGTPIAAVMFVISGVVYVTSVGDPGRVKTARNIMIYTAVGLAVILVSSGLIKVIQSLLEGS